MVARRKGRKQKDSLVPLSNGGPVKPKPPIQTDSLDRMKSSPPNVASQLERKTKVSTVSNFDAVVTNKRNGTSNGGGTGENDADLVYNHVEEMTTAGGEDAEENSDTLLDEDVAPFTKLIGVGDHSDTDEDGDAIMETLAVSDLPSRTMVEARNDEPALRRKLREIALFTYSEGGDVNEGENITKPEEDVMILPFRESLAVTMPFKQSLPDKLAVDDLARETAFAERTTEAVHLGFEELRKLGIKFRRPNDYFAEMIKGDDHMAKVKKEILHNKARIEAAEKRRNNRDLKKNRRKVRQDQVEKEQEKKRKARHEIEALSQLRTDRLRKRAEASSSGGGENDDDEFPIEMLDIEKLDSNQFKKQSVALRDKGTQTMAKKDGRSKKGYVGKKTQGKPGKHGPKGPVRKKVGKKKRLGRSRRLVLKK